ncbi:hypothetical protein EHP00_1421 [Ecytonucleospora hepatopenaei]|uniref:Uncharacterized protein n=1 Tax=Ecytonucleospora hepatopenaei TaxID=646526 RepID=A0A1W0E555_9MICR|nr:hypothetical protein EHP00_1421 [Ecytonucleospora hepatopenaei]
MLIFYLLSINTDFFRKIVKKIGCILKRKHTYDFCSSSKEDINKGKYIKKDNSKLFQAICNKKTSFFENEKDFSQNDENKPNNLFYESTKSLSSIEDNEVEQEKNHQTLPIVREWPYMVNKDILYHKIEYSTICYNVIETNFIQKNDLNLVGEKNITYIHNIETND